MFIFVEPGAQAVQKGGDKDVKWFNVCLFIFVKPGAQAVPEGGDGDSQWFNVCMFIFVEPGAQAVQEGGDGDVQMTAVNGDIADGASGGKDEEMEEGKLLLKPWI